jgi:hypothetical protein
MLVANPLAGRREHGHGERQRVKDAAEAYRYGYRQRGGRDGMTVVAAPTGLLSIPGRVQGRSARVTISRPGRSRTSSPRRSAQRSAHCGSKEVVMSATVESARDIRPFHVDVPQEELDDLRRRIGATNWPEKETVADQSRACRSP